MEQIKEAALITKIQDFANVGLRSEKAGKTTLIENQNAVADSILKINS